MREDCIKRTRAIGRLERKAMASRRDAARHRNAAHPRHMEEEAEVVYLPPPCIHRETLGSEALSRPAALASLDDETERESGGLREL